MALPVDNAADTRGGLLQGLESCHILHGEPSLAAATRSHMLTLVPFPVGCGLKLSPTLK